MKYVDPCTLRYFSRWLSVLLAGLTAISSDIQTFGAEPDSDGDGLSDAAEARAGTDPNSAASAFRILGSPRRVGNGWEVRWSSVSGKSYRLQRLDGDAIPPANLQWLDLLTIAANGTSTLAVDADAGSGKRFYRVVLVESVADTLAPTLGAVRAQPSTATAEGIVTLAVEATDDVAVAGVTFYDGINLLGDARRGAGALWEFAWPVTFSLNGSHSLTARATDAAGNTGVSTTLEFNVAIAQARLEQVVNEVIVAADNLQRNGATVTASGNISVGNVAFSAGTTLNINLDTGVITGEGEATLSGVGLVMNGAFTIDSNTGWMSASSASSITPEINVNSTTLLRANELEVNVKTGAIQGRGSISMQVPGGGLQALQSSTTPASIVTFSGEFSIDSRTQTATVTGMASYGGVAGTGSAAVNLATSAFTLSGTVSIASGPYDQLWELNSATFALVLRAGERPEFTINGRPVLAPLAQLSITLNGSMNLEGSISLTGEVNGALGPFSFNPVSLTLTRDSSDGGQVAVKYRGVFQVQGLDPLILEGQVLPSGLIAPPSLDGELKLAGGLSIQPRANEPTRLRLSVKYILDSDGNRPATNNNLATDDQVRAQIELGNQILRRSGNEFQFELVEITEVANASDWFMVNARSSTNRHDLQKAVLRDLQKYKFRFDAVNIYINGSSGSGNSAVYLPDQIILCGQGGNSTLIPHEVGHYFGLWHTQGRSCGGCGEPPVTNIVVLDQLCVSIPDTDFVADTILDIECWDQNQIAELNFQRPYDQLTALEKSMVNAVFFNLMSYHDDPTDSITPGQVARVRFNAFGPRFHVVDRPSVLEFLSEEESRLQFKLDGQVRLSAAAGGQTFDLGGAVSIEKTGASFQFDATIPPIDMGDFRIESASGGALSASIGTAGITVSPGARLLYKGEALTLPALPQFTIAANGDFIIGVDGTMTAGLKFGDFDMLETGFTFRFVAGTPLIESVRGTLVLPEFGPAGPLTFTGSFTVDQQNQTMTLAGSASYANVSGTGTATIQLAGPAFVLRGEVMVGSGTVSDPVLLNDATLELRIAAGEPPRFLINGKPALAPLAVLNVNLSGSMDLSGKIDLSAQANGELGPFSFNPVAISLTRDSSAWALPAIKYRGVFQLRGLDPLTLEGQILPDGRITPPELSGELNLAAGIRFVPGNIDPQKIRVSVKFIEDGMGNGPSGDLSTDDHVREQIARGNAILAGAGNRYQFDLLDIVRVSAASNHFNVSARDRENRKALEGDALKNPIGYALRPDAVNIYINGHDSSGIAPGGFPQQLILIGQGGRPTTIAHEIGHYLGLAHTQGGDCGACDDPNLDIKCTEPGDDEIADTLPDVQCWTTNDIAQWSFQQDYINLSPANQAQVDAVFFNLMSYHDTRDRLTAGQIDRMQTAADGPRFHVIDRGSILKFLSESSGGLDFQVNGSFQLIIGSSSPSLSVDGKMTIEKTANGPQIRSFSAASVNSDLALDLPGGFRLQNGSVRIEKNAAGLFEVFITGDATLGSATMSVTAKLSGRDLTISAIVPTLRFGDFTLEAGAGGEMSASIGANGVTIDAGARLLYKGVPMALPSLPQLIFNAKGDLTAAVINAANTAAELNAYLLENTSFTFQVVGGVASMQNVKATLKLPGLTTAASISLSGQINQDGTFRLTGTNTAVLSFTSLEFGTIQPGATFTLTQDGLVIAGLLNNKTIAQLGIDAPRITLRVTATGQASLREGISVRVSPIEVGEFRLESTARDGSFTAELTSRGLTLPIGARLLYKGVALTDAALPVIFFDHEGSTVVEVDASMTAGLKLGEFPLPRSTFTFKLSAQAAIAEKFTGTLSIPGLSSAASVRVVGDLNSNGTFALTGETTAAMNFTGMPLGTLSARASVTLSDKGLTLSGNVSGPSFTLVKVTPPTLTLQLSAAGAVSFVGSPSITVPPIVAGQFRLESTQARGEFTVAITPSGLVFPTGARLFYKDIALTTASLPPFRIEANGNIRITVGASMTGDLALGGFDLTNSSFLFQVANGLGSATSFKGTLEVPGASVDGSVTVEGALNSDGTYSLTTLSAAAITLNGLAVTGMADALATLTPENLTISGRLTGGALGHVTTVGNATAVLTVTRTGQVTVAATLTIAPITAGQALRIESTATGGNFTASIGATLSLNQTARVLLNNVPVINADLPALNISPNGNFTATTGSGTLTLGGFSIATGSVTASRTAGVLSVTGRGNLRVPTPTGGTLLNVSVNGSINSNGSYALTGSTASQLNLSGLPFGGIASGAAVTLDQNGVTIDGTATGGALNFVSVIGSAKGVLTVANNGSATVSGAANISALVADKFRFESAAGGNFSATFNASGLAFTQQGRLLFNNAPLVNVNFPAPTIAANGNFSVTVSGAAMTLDGYSLANAGVTFARSSGQMTVQIANATHVPPSGPNINFNGSIMSDGTISLTSSLNSGSLAAFPVQGGLQFVSGPSRYRSAVILDEPYAYWRLGDAPDKAGVLIAKDEEVDHHGAPTATIKHGFAGAIAGDANTAFTFTGVDQVNVTSPVNFNHFGAFTLEAWIKANGFSRDKAYDAIFTKGDSAWRIQRAAGTSKIAFDTDGLNPPYLNGTTDVDDGQWHHVVAVYDGAKKYIYIDGKLDASVTVTGTPAGNSHNVLIGANAQVAGRNWTGGIDEVAFYKKALVHTDVVRHFVAGKGHALSGYLRLQRGDLASVDLRGYISSTGGFSFDGSASSSVNLAGFRFDGTKFSFHRNSGAFLSTFTASGALNLGPLGAALDFSPSFDGTINSAGSVRLKAEFVPVQLLGYEFGEVDFHLEGPITGTTAMVWTNGFLSGVKFPYLNGQMLHGTLNNIGGVNMSKTLSVNLAGFAADCTVTLNNAQGLRASGSFNLGIDQLSGSANFSGGISTSGAVTLETALTGSLTFATHTFDFENRLTLNNTEVKGNGILNFGEFDLSGSFSAKRSPSTVVSFTGSASDDTGFLSFGRRYSGNPLSPDGGPGHPKAKFDWDAAASFNGTTLSATYSGDLIVEYEKLGGGYAQETFHFDSRELPGDGKISLTPSKSFSDALDRSISTFSFDLP